MTLNCTAPGALTRLRAALGTDYLKSCTKPYSQECRPARTAAQRDKVNGQPCWECTGSNATGTASFHSDGRSKKQKTRMADGTFKKLQYRTHDHQPPLNEAWEKGGCHLGIDGFKELMGRAEFALPHCEKHYMAQGTKVKKKVAKMRG